MKKTLIILAGLTILPTIGRSAENQIWISPKAIEKREGWSNHGPKTDFLPTIINEKNWPQVLENTHVFKTYRNVLTEDTHIGQRRLRFTDAQLRELIAFVTAHELGTAIEVGGLRFSAKCDGKGMGKAYALDIEIPALKRWEKLGGTIDYITTDNMYGLYCKGKHKYQKKDTVLTLADMPVFVAEAVDSLKEMQSAFPDARLGIIECPDYFCFRFDNGKESSPTPKYAPAVYFKDYMETFLQECKRKKVVIAHFHFDYHIQGFIRDANLLHGKNLSLQQMPAADDLCLERVRQINAFFRKRGIATGICITPGAYGNKVFSDSPNLDAARSIKTVFSAFAKSNIKMDHLLFQHWHEFPTRNGPERQAETFMHNILQIMRSEDFKAVAGK